MKFVEYARAAGHYTGFGRCACSRLWSTSWPRRSGPLNDFPTHTRTPIKHVIVIIGENRSFDHVYATYKSPSGDKVSNLLSKGIINADGTPGPKYAHATARFGHRLPARSFPAEPHVQDLLPCASHAADGWRTQDVVRSDGRRGAN